MSYIPVIDMIDAMIELTAQRANDAAAARPWFDSIGASVGVNLRLSTLVEIKNAVVKLGLIEYENAMPQGLRTGSLVPDLATRTVP